MGHHVELNGTSVGVFDPSTGKVQYHNEIFEEKVSEIIAGQSAGQDFTQAFARVRVVYKWDRNRARNNDTIFAEWKGNPLMANRVRILNSMIFGRGFSYTYDKTTKETIDRFWRINKLSKKLNKLGADSQLYGEVFMALTPQRSGDVLVTIYESGNVEIDTHPSSVDLINFYGVAYRDEEKSEDVYLKFKPLDTYLMEYEMQQSVVGNAVRKVRSALGLGSVRLSGFDGIMVHLPFNNSSAEAHGTSDFRQAYPYLNDYSEFLSDRLDIHHRYASPAYDITIDTEDPQKIQDRISELVNFNHGDNPVHNNKETWKMLEWSGNTPDSQEDAGELKGMICAGMSMPEHILFCRSDGDNDDATDYALNKLAEDRQDSYGDMFTDIHKFVGIVGGIEPSAIDAGRLIFPEVSTMSEKVKAETYVLKVGAKIVSRETAAYNCGHDWDLESERILEEIRVLGDPRESSSVQGTQDGRDNTRLNSGQDGANTDSTPNPNTVQTDSVAQGSDRRQSRSE